MVVVQDYPEEELEPVKETFSWNVEQITEAGPAISLHTMKGSTKKAYQTMRMIGSHKKKLIHLLIDLGSTNNFLDLTISKTVGL